MATTEKGIYYPSDYDEVADIPDDMKKMAESIDETIGNSEAQVETLLENKVDKVVGKGLSTEDYTTAEKNKLANLENYDDTDVKADIQENANGIESLEEKHNAEVAELQSKIAELKEELEATADLNPTEEASGENITLNDSARYKFKKLVVNGSSEQETREGYNHFKLPNSSTSNGIQFVNNGNGTFDISGTASAVTQFLIVIPLKESGYEEGKTYSLMCSEALGALTFFVHNCSSSGTWNKTQLAFTSDETKKNKKFTTPTTEYISCVVKVENGTTVNLKNVKVQVIEGTEDKEYEQYGASPSSEYPSEIRNVGNNINRFNKDTITEEKYIDNAGSEKILAGNFHSDYIPVIPLEVLTRSGTTVQNTFAKYDKNKNFLGRDSFSAEIGHYTVPNDTYYLILNGLSIDKETTKLEGGSIATGYSSYNCGSVDVKVTNGNITSANELYQQMKRFAPNVCREDIIDKIEVIRFPNSTYMISNGFNAINYKFKETTSYTIRGKFKRESSGPLYIQILYTDGTTNHVFINNEDWTELRIVSDKNKTIDKIGFSFGNSAYWYLDKSSWFIGEGDTTDYVSHEEQIATFPLSEGQVLHEEDYIGDRIYQKRVTIVLTGNEQLNFYKELEDVSSFYLTVPYKPKASYQKADICSHFKNLEHSPSWGFLANTFALSDSKTLYVSFNSSNISTVAEFKTFLAQQYANGTPVTVEYELATSIETELTDEQKEAKAEIDKLYSYKGITHISSNNDPSPTSDITYRKDIETMINNLTTAIVAQGGV